MQMIKTTESARHSRPLVHARPYRFQAVEAPGVVGCAVGREGRSGVAEGLEDVRQRAGHGSGSWATVSVRKSPVRTEGARRQPPVPPLPGGTHTGRISPHAGGGDGVVRGGSSENKKESSKPRSRWCWWWWPGGSHLSVMEMMGGIKEPGSGQSPGSESSHSLMVGRWMTSQKKTRESWVCVRCGGPLSRPDAMGGPVAGPGPRRAHGAAPLGRDMLQKGCVQWGKLFQPGASNRVSHSVLSFRYPSAPRPRNPKRPESQLAPGSVARGRSRCPGRAVAGRRRGP